MMQTLDKDLRGALEKTIKAARSMAETAALAAVEQLGVGQDKPEAYLSDDQKRLRNRLRTHGKQLGDARDSKSPNPTYGKQEGVLPVSLHEIPPPSRYRGASVHAHPEVLPCPHPSRPSPPLPPT